MSTDLTGRAVVLGLDGATWDLLLPLAERGVMPNLKRALEELGFFSTKMRIFGVFPASPDRDDHAPPAE